LGESLSEQDGKFVLVAPERGLDRAEGGLTYRVPESLDSLSVGERVEIPLGRGGKTTTGYVVGMLDKPDIEVAKIKPIAGRAGGAKLCEDLVELAQWMARYYQCPLGMVFAALLPAAVSKGVGLTQRTEVRRLPALDLQTTPEKLTALQKSILESAPDWTEVNQLMQASGAKTKGPIKTLIGRSLLEKRKVEHVHGPLETMALASAQRREPVNLSEDQRQAVEAVTATLDESWSTFLLHGVTGSGKTEVYIRIIEEALAKQQSAIVLVPEIALTPQTVGRFLARFERVAILHSGLTSAQRHAQWRRIENGEADVVVGARSAVFAPLSNLGIIIVDEEHDTSYKQDQLPRYHARDVAVRRAQMVGASVLLGSATPSLETYHNAGGLNLSSFGSTKTSEPAEAKSTYQYLSMPRRAPGLQLPHVEVIDLTEERRQRNGVHLMSQRLEHELTRLTEGPMDERGQAMILLNRRGYANYIACPDHRCGYVMLCDHCDTTMVYHLSATRRLEAGNTGIAAPRGRLQCHHCHAEKEMPEQCPLCGKKLTLFGLGTQRVERELARKFPNLRVSRMDSDAMRSGKDYHDTLEAFRLGKTDVLLGTQMIAKGLDFPGVRLVAVICADTSLNLPDFRAAERTYQLVSQVAGRAGRGDQPSRVLLQSFNPTDPTLLRAAEGDYAGFAAEELVLRQQAGLPPMDRMARLVLRDLDMVKLTGRGRLLAQQLQNLNQQLSLQVRLRGPLACPIARVADYHRQQILLTATSAGELQRLLTAARNHLQLKSDHLTAVDVDPVSML